MKKNSKTKKQTTMKKQMTKMIAAMILLASGFLANANENEREITLKTENSKSVVLDMKNIIAGTDISIWSQDGQLLYQDEVIGDSYTRVFNLQKLEKGELTLELENEGRLVILPISVSETSAVLMRGKEVAYTKPVLKVANGEMKVFLSEGHKCFEMSMNDQYGAKVFNENISKNENGIKRYDITNLSGGKYNIKFTADGRSFYHTIIVK